MWIGVLWAGLRVAMWIAHVGGKYRHGLLEKPLNFAKKKRMVGAIQEFGGCTRQSGSQCSCELLALWVLLAPDYYPKPEDLQQKKTSV